MRGEAATFVALVLEGTLDVRAPGVQQRILMAGSVVGYAPLFQGGEREGDVTVATEALIAVISYPEVSHLAASGHAGAARLVSLLARCMYVHILAGQLADLGELGSDILPAGRVRDKISLRKLSPLLTEHDVRDWPSQVSRYCATLQHPAIMKMHLRSAALATGEASIRAACRNAVPAAQVQALSEIAIGI